MGCGASARPRRQVLDVPEAGAARYAFETGGQPLGVDDGDGGDEAETAGAPSDDVPVATPTGARALRGAAAHSCAVGARRVACARAFGCSHFARPSRRPARRTRPPLRLERARARALRAAEPTPARFAAAKHWALQSASPTLLGMQGAPVPDLSAEVHALDVEALDAQQPQPTPGDTGGAGAPWPAPRPLPSQRAAERPAELRLPAPSSPLSRMSGAALGARARPAHEHGRPHTCASAAGGVSSAHARAAAGGRPPLGGRPRTTSGPQCYSGATDARAHAVTPPAKLTPISSAKRGAPLHRRTRSGGELAREWRERGRCSRGSAGLQGGGPGGALLDAAADVLPSSTMYAHGYAQVLHVLHEAEPTAGRAPSTEGEGAAGTPQLGSHPLLTHSAPDASASWPDASQAAGSSGELPSNASALGVHAATGTKQRRPVAALLARSLQGTRPATPALEPLTRPSTGASSAHAAGGGREVRPAASAELAQLRAAEAEGSSLSLSASVADSRAHSPRSARFDEARRQPHAPGAQTQRACISLWCESVEARALHVRFEPCADVAWPVTAFELEMQAVSPQAAQPSHAHGGGGTAESPLAPDGSRPRSVLDGQYVSVYRGSAQRHTLSGLAPGEGVRLRARGGTPVVSRWSPNRIEWGEWTYLHAETRAEPPDAPSLALSAPPAHAPLGTALELALSGGVRNDCGALSACRLELCALPASMADGHADADGGALGGLGALELSRPLGVAGRPYDGAPGGWPITLDGLEPGRTYRLRAALVGAGGISGWSAPLVARTARAAPTAPSPPAVASARESAISLSWPPAQIDGFRLRHYVLHMTELGSAAELLARRAELLAAHSPLGARGAVVYSGESTRHEVALLEPARAFAFRLRVVVSAAGAHGGLAPISSPWSEPTLAATDAARPAEPLPPHVREIGCEHALVEWRAPADGGQPIVSYQLQVRLLPRAGAGVGVGLGVGGSASDSALCACGAVGATSSSGLHAEGVIIADLTIRAPHAPADGSAPAPPPCGRVSGLRPGLSYTARVSAANAVGLGGWSARATFVTAAAPPAQMGAPSVLDVSESSLSVRWDAPAANGSPIVHYELEIAPLEPPDGTARAPSAGCATATAPPLPSLLLRYGSAVESALIEEGLRPGGAYELRARASNRVGAGAWSVALRVLTVGTELPPLACTPVVAAKTSTTIGLRWGRSRRGASDRRSDETLYSEWSDADSDAAGAAPARAHGEAASARASVAWDVQMDRARRIHAASDGTFLNQRDGVGVADGAALPGESVDGGSFAGLLPGALARAPYVPAALLRAAPAPPSACAGGAAPTADATGAGADEGDEIGEEIEEEADAADGGRAAVAARPAARAVAATRAGCARSSATRSPKVPRAHGSVRGRRASFSSADDEPAREVSSDSELEVSEGDVASAAAGEADSAPGAPVLSRSLPVGALGAAGARARPSAAAIVSDDDDDARSADGREQPAAPMDAQRMDGAHSPDALEEGWTTIYCGEANAFEASGLQPACVYRFRVRALASGHVGAWSSPLLCTTDAADTTQRVSFSQLAVHEVLGEGAFSIVYRGECAGSVVAIKKLKYQQMDSETMDKFAKELAIISRVR